MLRKIFKFFTTNIGAKLLALFFALSVWVYVAAGEAKVGDFPGRIPIEAKNIPAGMAVADDLGTCQIKIKAPYSTWQNLSIDNFSASVDLDGLDAGIYKVDVNVKVSDSSVSVVEKNPPKVTVKIEPLTEKKVPISVKIDGRPADGYATSEISAEPQEVEIKGAKSFVDNISAATALIKLNRENSDLERNIKLIALDNSGNEVKNVSFQPDNIKVKVLINKATNTKTVGIKANISGDPKENYWISRIIVVPSVAAVTGEPEELKDLEYLDTAKVDINGISETITKEADLILPEGIALISNQKKVKVTVYVSPNLSIREIPATLMYKGKMGTTDSTVKVKLSGPVYLLNGISSRDISAVIDLNGRSSGPYTINRSDITVPVGAELIDYSPKIINIRTD